MWSCKHCSETNDDDQLICWHCGTGKDGSAPPSGWRSELATPVAATDRELNCLRCASSMIHTGRKNFHEGSYLAEVVLGELSTNREAFDVYACSNCGKVEFFLASHSA